MDSNTKSSLIAGVTMLFFTTVAATVSVTTALAEGGEWTWAYWAMTVLFLAGSVGTCFSLYYTVELGITRARLEEIDRNIETLNKIKEAL